MALDCGNDGTFLIMGNARFISESSTVVMLVELFKSLNPAVKMLLTALQSHMRVSGKQGPWHGP